MQELDEATYWLDLLIDADVVPDTKMRPLCQEANELTAILVSCVRTTKTKKD